MSDCVFCERIRVGKYDRLVNSVVDFEPLNPVVDGHRLFVPFRHVRDAAEHPKTTADVFYVASVWAAKELGRRTQAFNLITSAGAAATQTVWHLHVHYVPRAPDDGLHLPWTGQHDS